MNSSGSVTQWLQILQTGEDAAARLLWDHYCTRLVDLARAKLRGAPRRAADEEDVALSVFDSLCRGIEEQRFRDLKGRDDLWRLLVVLTARKALRQVQHERRHKRGGGKVVPEADLSPADAGRDAGLDAIIGREPSPEFAAQVADECRRLLDLLDDDELRTIARGKMEGYTNAEIAAQLGCLKRTVERKLRVIRGLWQDAS
jgi:DNA-directed RNA polymerase specialized sigma24 family protein